MKIKKRDLLFIILLFAVVFLLFPHSHISNITFIEFILFSIIGIISFFEISIEVKKRTYSLNLIHWLFILFFYFLAPIQQIINDYQPWGLSIDSSSTIKTCLIIITWIIFYKIGYYIFGKTKTSSKDKVNKKIENINISNLALTIVTIINIMCCVFFIKSIGFQNLFSRKTATLSLETITGSMNQIANLLLNHGLKSVIPFSLAISLINYIKTKKGIIYLIINSILFLTVCFPTGLGRSEAANMYLGLFVILLYRNINKNRKSLKYVLLFISVFVLVFPIINSFRNLAFGDVNIAQAINSTTSDISRTYLSGDYDAFSMINQARIYVNQNEITYGRQLLGALFFFVPRSIWNNKATGSGYMIFSHLGKDFKNVSCPLIAEGYINFGIIGVILFALIISAITHSIDKYYWTIIDESDEVKVNLITILYPFLLPSYFILQRGDLQSIFAFTVAIVSVFYLMYNLIKLKIKIR